MAFTLVEKCNRCGAIRMCKTTTCKKCAQRMKQVKQRLQQLPLVGQQNKRCMSACGNVAAITILRDDCMLSICGECVLPGDQLL